MSYAISSSEHVAKKKHRCYYCDELIYPGEKYGKRFGVDGGDVWDMKFHFECAYQADEVEKWDSGDYECYAPGEMKRPMHAFDPGI